jgi:murein DD-endopeptidase MepM/ murein hydrolase activator NlpD
MPMTSRSRKAALAASALGVALSSWVGTARISSAQDNPDGLAAVVTTPPPPATQPLATLPPTTIAPVATAPLPAATPAPTAPTTPPAPIPASVPVATAPAVEPVIAAGATTTGVPIATVLVANPTNTVVDTSTTTSSVESSTTSSSTILSPVAIGDSSEEAVPIEDAPNVSLPPLPPGKFVPLRDTNIENLLLKLSKEKRASVELFQKKADEAQARVAVVLEEIQELQDRQDQLRSDQDVLRAKVERSAIVIRARALSIYAGAGLNEIDLILRSEDPTILGRRVDLINQAQQAEAKAVLAFRSDSQALQQSLEEVEKLAASKTQNLEQLQNDQAALGAALEKAKEDLSSVLSGYQIALNGWVFPVEPIFSFVDTFGAPRMTGTKYVHTHQGTDIFGAQGSPLHAVQRGVILKKGTGVLGGNKLWLKSAVDGTEYYYAHLDAFVEGVENGTVVEAGQVIGFLGRTGNAITTPPHLHFEIHPENGSVVANPFPTLDAVRKADGTAFIQAQQAGFASPADVTATTIPGADRMIRAGVGVNREFVIGDVYSPIPLSTLPPGTKTPEPQVRPAPNP